MAREYDVVIVGAGISGITLAERYANVLGRKVLLVEKRDHIGGNCYDYFDGDGILVHPYGPHYFHTAYPEVWEYVSRFTDWIPYVHRVLSYVDGKYVPVPVNIDTVNILFDLDIRDEVEMREWLDRNVVKYEIPRNSEESALSRVGPTLYEKMFKNYTIKQWDMHPRELDPAVMDRIPVHFDHDDRFFTDPYQGLPHRGMTGLFERMLDHPRISVNLESDYFDLEDSLGEREITIYTGPIDRFFDYRYGKLQYRSLRFEIITLDEEWHQPQTVVNYPNDHAYTRVHEPKHATETTAPRTTIIREYGSWEGEPIYPVLNDRNRAILEKYRAEAEKTDRVFFAGRLATYKYINMDQAFKNALELFFRLNPAAADAV
ncbi:MAG: UDP-galactopyranose mutase [Actinobacteria bacterium]|nr:MAG: UDP-galactopyranose mutase [Actinomycetota bacterium]